MANDDGNRRGKDKVGENKVNLCKSSENNDLRGLEKIQKADNTLIMYTGKCINVICHFLLHIYWENESKKETINSKWRHNVRKKGKHLSKTVTVLTVILTGTHFWELVLQDWKPSHQSEKNCVCLTSLYPLLKKEQDCQYTTQGSRLKCYSISLRYKIYQSFVLYFAFYIFQNKMKIHTYS